MTWLEIDDRLLEHPKFIRAIKLAGADALYLWLGIRAYCGQNLTDGHVPSDMLDEVRGPTSKARRAAALKALLTVKLLEKAPDGVVMHDYLDWSSSRDVVLARRDRARERKAKSRDPSQGMSRRDGPRDSRVTDAVTPRDVTCPSRAPVHSPPLPSTPIHSEEEESPLPPAASESRSPMHANWKPGSETVAAFEVAMIPPWAIEQIVARFRGHFCANKHDQRTDAEWNQSCSKWVLRDWNNPTKRPQKPDADEIAAAKAIERRRKAAEELARQREEQGKKDLEELRRRGIEIPEIFNVSSLMEGV